MVSQCSSPVSVLGQIRQAVSSQTLPLRFALMLRLENHTVRIKKCKHNEILLRQPNQERRTAYACTVHETDTKKNKKKTLDQQPYQRLHERSMERPRART